MNSEVFMSRNSFHNSKIQNPKSKIATESRQGVNQSLIALAKRDFGSPLEPFLLRLAIELKSRPVFHRAP